MGATPHPPASFAHHQYNPDDKAEILEKVDKSVGVKELNTLVIAESNAAVTDLAVRAAEASEPGSKLRVQVAKLLNAQGKYQEERVLLEGVVAAHEAGEGAEEGGLAVMLEAKDLLRQ